MRPKTTVMLVLAAMVLAGCQTPNAEDVARACEAKGLARDTAGFNACIQQAEASRSARTSARPSNSSY